MQQACDSLFRPGVGTRRSEQFGAVMPWRPVRFRAGIVALVGICIGLGCGVGLLPYAQKVTVTGWVKPTVGPTSVVAPERGRIVALAVQTGSAVSRGARLATLDRTRVLAGGGSVDEAERRMLREQLQRLRRKLTAQRALHHQQHLGLRQNVAALERTHHTLERVLNLKQSRARLARENLQRIKTLYADGWLGVVDFNTARQRALDEAVQVQDARLGYQQAAARHAQGRRQVEEQRARAAVLELELEDEIAQVRHRLERAPPEILWLTAPHDGTVMDVRVEHGAAVDVNTPVMTIVSGPRRLFAELFASARDVGRMAVGQHVWLRFEGYPHAEFGMGRGRIAHIAGAPRVAQDQTLYRLKVSVDRLPHGVSAPPVGMGVAADVVVQRKVLWRWLGDPLLGMWRRL